MKKTLGMALVFSQLSWSLAQAAPSYYLTDADQPFYKNDSNGKNDLERIDNDVREINRLYAEVNALKAEVKTIKEVMAQLQAALVSAKTPEKKP